MLYESAHGPQAWRVHGHVLRVPGGAPRGPVQTETRQPDAWLELALDRKNGRRHVISITMAGFVVALLLGVGSLVTGFFQAVVAYLARKHP